MFCRNCGKELMGTPEICLSCGARPLAGNGFCHGCGAAVSPLAEICVKCGARLTKAELAKAEEKGISPKSRLATTLLACPLLIGMFGAHRFYLGKIGTAVTMLVLTIVGIITSFVVIGFVLLAATWIWALIDFIYAVSGSMKDKQGNLIKNW